MGLVLSHLAPLLVNGAIQSYFSIVPMIIKKIQLHNWKNFQNCEDIELSERCFVVGANASGKSNFIDVLRFLRDIAKQSGGLQSAVEGRGGITKMRCLAARKRSDIAITIELGEPDKDSLWQYQLAITQTGGGVIKKQARILSERVLRYQSGKPEIILDRSENSKTEKEDDETLRYTYLEQPTANRDFRELQRFFQSIEYLNIVPQLVRESNSSLHSDIKEDYYGRNFLEKLTKMNERTRKSYFRKINDCLKIAVPQLEELEFVKDESGVPHLEARYKHWRSRGSKQQEPQFSDGTLRLIGFLFALLDNNGVILLEEPELNLHSGIVAQLPEFISKILRQKKKPCQTILTTHSYDILSNRGISPDEVLLLLPSAEGTQINSVSKMDDIKPVLDAGFTIADAVIPATKPEGIEQMTLVNITD
ncbi:chromosome segregation protein SMC [Planctomycetales bacterium]|nr:chromosome segregation protein SMC [Planctomycetales bacterium]